MSMLYVWHPTLMDDGQTVQVMITRGDSDRVGKGSKTFLAAILEAIGVKSAAKTAKIESFRCNFYSEYWQEPGWESRWDLAWRCRIHLAEPATRLKKMGEYVGIDQIDESARSTTAPPFLLVAEFTTEAKAAAAAEGLATDEEVQKHAGSKKKAPKTEILKYAAKEFHLHAELGAFSKLSEDGNYPDAAVAHCEAEGGRVHAQ